MKQSELEHRVFILGISQAAPQCCWVAD